MADDQDVAIISDDEESRLEIVNRQLGQFALIDHDYVKVWYRSGSKCIKCDT